MAHFEQSASNRVNFASHEANQTNNFWVPEIFSQKVQVAFRKAAVSEAITN